MGLNESNILINRYPGIKPFSVEEQPLFFGRTNDIDSLNSLISIKQIVILYGKSGYGKSSLINAGIIPRLKQNESWLHFSIRFNNFSEKAANQNLSPAKTIKERLAVNIKVNESSEFYNLLPNEDSFWYWIKHNELENSKSKFILFFDQFEELFTYPKEQITEFSEQLSQLLYTTVPSKFRRRIDELEEYNPISNELHDFVYEKPEIKIVLSIRSDKLSLLNNLKDKHPTILQNCFELDALNMEDAALAIIEPAKLPQQLGFKTPPFEFTPDAINKILNSIANVQDGKIEAATLQIVCRYVEDNLVLEKNKTLITQDILGNINDIFQQYYEGVLNKLTPDEKIKAQDLIENQLIEGGSRNPLMEAFILNRFHLSKSLLSKLEESSLLRKEQDAKGRNLYEISHDTLINAITKVADSRRKVEEEQKRRQLEQQIEDERKRANDFKNIKEKAVVRLKLVVGLAIISIFIAAVAVYFMLQTSTITKQVKIETNMEKKVRQNAIMDSVKFRKEQAARDDFNFAEEYIRANGDSSKSLAKQDLEKALQNMKGYEKDSFYRVILKCLEKCQ